MRPYADYEAFKTLHEQGMRDQQIAEITRIPRSTVRGWRGRLQRGGDISLPDCPICSTKELDHQAYSYLLGLYLGDGCLSEYPRKVRLRVTLDDRYPNIIAECEAAIARIRGSGKTASRVQSEGCTQVSNYWKHWPCLFPQHGLGKKHQRSVRLLPWQLDITREHPQLFLRGLIHSDGSRYLNRVHVGGRAYSYSQYEFTNFSNDIREMFSSTCDQLCIVWRRGKESSIVISRRKDVSLVDGFVGPKT